jgi:hypothetical protein
VRDDVAATGDAMSGPYNKVVISCACCKRVCVVAENGIIEIQCAVVCADCKDHIMAMGPADCEYRVEEIPAATLDS